MDFTTILWIAGALIVFQVGSSIYRKRKTKDFLVGQLDWILRLLTALYQNAKDCFMEDGGISNPYNRVGSLLAALSIGRRN